MSRFGCGWRCYFSAKQCSPLDAPTLLAHTIRCPFSLFTTWWPVTSNKYFLGSVMRFRGLFIVFFFFFTKLYRSLVDAAGNWIEPPSLAVSRQAEYKFGVTPFWTEWWRGLSVIRTILRNEIRFRRHFTSNFMEPSSSNATDWARKTLCANICTSRPIYLRCVCLFVAAKNFVCINK